MKKWVIVLVAVVVLAGVGGSAYYLGMKAGEKRVLQNPTLVFQSMRDQGGQFQGQGQFPVPEGTPQAGRGGTLVRGGGLMGTIESIEGNTVVIKTTDGSTRVQTTDTTLIEKTMSVTVSDLKVGESVVVSGSKNDDGSYTARSIQSLRGQASPASGQ